MIDLKVEYKKIIEADLSDEKVIEQSKKITARRQDEVRAMVRNNYQSTIQAYEKEKKTVINFILDKLADAEASKILDIEMATVENMLNTNFEGIKVV